MSNHLDAAHQKARLAAEQLANIDQEWAWKFRLMDARALLREHKSDEVLALLSSSLPAQLKATDIALQRTLLQAYAYASQGRREEVNRALQLAETMAGSLAANTHPSQLRIESLNALGLLYLQRATPEDLVRANTIFQQNLKVAHQQNDQYQLTNTLTSLAFVALRRERFDEALDWSNEVLKIAHTIDARGDIQKAQGTIAWANYKLGNFEEALSGFQIAEQSADALGQQTDRMQWLNNIGLCFYRLGHPQEAETFYNQALKAAQMYQDVEEETDVHIAMAELFLQTGNLALATQHTEQALSLARSAGRTSDEMDGLFLQGLLYEKQGNVAEATKTLTELDGNPGITPSLHWQVEGALANLYAEARQPVLAEKWYRQSITVFETQRESIKKEESKLPFSTNADQLYDDYIRFLVERGRTDEALQWLDVGKARTLEEGLGIGSANFKDSLKKPVLTTATARNLHGTILVYNLSGAGSYLWAITGAGTRCYKLPPESEIDEHVRNYQRAILDSRDTLANAYADGMALYKILVEPAAGLIPKNSPVYIIPDGSLETLNFETLLAPGGGLHYWIEDATITNASSLKLLATFHPQAGHEASKKLLLIGDPISPEDRYPQLAYAPKEISSIAKHFPATEKSVFTQQQALSSTYESSEPGQYSYIHFVAHGTSSSESPLDSAIVLSRNPANPDSYKLYARDVIHEPLHAQLVTISACYGSGARAYGGEGLVGLSWAFLRAGSHYVIGSLWEVSDAATPDLMDQMYGLLADGQPPDQALRAAKLSLVHSHGVYRKPLYWATFQLYGGS